jgi:phytoene synthase
MEPDLALSYARCRELHRKHGRTYYLATRLLPAWKRPHAHALYGFARYADDIVDVDVDTDQPTQAARADQPAGPGDAPDDRAQRLRDWSERFLAGLAGEPVDDPLLPAVLDTVRRFDLDVADFAHFIDSMAMDLTIDSYADYAALTTYMEGSAAAIGTLMLPLLEPTDLAEAREPARQLGFAVQMTNFVRDVVEDLGRGRVYLPEEDLRRFDVTRADLTAAAANRAATEPLRELIRYEAARARAHYAAAAPGVTMLAPSSQRCLRVAYHLYAGILDEVKHANHDVFVRRAVVPNRRRLTVAFRSLRTPAGTPVTPPA